MDRSHYPALASSKLIHLDASAAFPLHQDVIAAVNKAMLHTLGASDKAQYGGALDVSRQVKQIRQEIADYIDADVSEIFLVASATDAVRTIGTMWAKNAKVLYSPEDHSRIIYEIAKVAESTCSLAYNQSGLYEYGSVAEDRPDVAILSHMHHVYGSDNDIQIARSRLPNTKIIVDASQSISRIPVNVRVMDCDALFFSSQKLGGIAGVGVLYIAKKHHLVIERTYVEPNTLPIMPLISLQAAIQLIAQETLRNISLHLTKLTGGLLDSLSHLPRVHFTKGPAFPSSMCTGDGIVSFSVEGYSSQDIAMILADQGIQVRAGDHCVDPTTVDQDVVRISMYQYTTKEELDKLVEIISTL